MFTEVLCPVEKLIFRLTIFWGGSFFSLKRNLMYNLTRQEISLHACVCLIFLISVTVKSYEIIFGVCVPVIKGVSIFFACTRRELIKKAP